MCLRANPDASEGDASYARSMPGPRLVATVLTAVAVSVWAATLALLVGHPVSGSAGAVLVGLTFAGLVTAGLGLCVAHRVPHNVVGPLLAWVGAILVVLAAREAYYRSAIEHDLPLDTRFVALFDESGWWLLVAVSLLLLYFPDGRLRRRWRWVPAALVASAAAHQVMAAFLPEPFAAPLSHVPRPFDAAPAYVEAVDVVVFFGMLAVFLASCVSIWLRRRKAHGVRRAQFTWLATAGALLLAYPLVCLAEIVLTGRSGPVATGVGMVAVILLPLAVTIAMLRHDLYDVDRLFVATLTYSVVTGLLLGLYTAVTAAAGVVLGGESTAAAALAAAGCALALAPLRRRVHLLVDRRLRPPRRAALQALESLSADVLAGVAPPEELEQRLRAALGDDSLTVAIASPGELADVDGRTATIRDRVPVVVGSTTVGVLSSSRADVVSVLMSVSDDAAPLLEVVRLRAQLTGALHEVQEGSARLLHATYEERRRLERDLHDGAQQRLVSLGMAVRLAQRHLDDGTVGVDGLLDHVVAELQTAIVELRRLAHGVRPSGLEEGLEPALSAITHTLPVPVDLDVRSEPTDDDLALTAYFVAAEAVTNAAKHADAKRIRVTVDQVAGELRVRIHDDGCGGARLQPASGLSGLRDRVAAIGGELTVVSPAGGGTLVEAVLPCAS